MKTKLTIPMLIMLLMLIACSTQPTTTQTQNTPISIEENYAIREIDIEDDNQQYLTPDNWQNTPASCNKSLLKLWLFADDKAIISSGSASLINSEQYHDIKGNTVWVHHVLTADHVVKDDNQKITDSKIVVFPHDYQDQNLVFGYVGYTQVADSNNKPLDVGIYSFFSLGTNTLAPYLIPAGVQSLTSDGHMLPGTTDFFYSFGYPNNIQNPQYVVATVNKTENDYVYLRPLPKNSNVTGGNSGGSVCNQDNQLVGIVSKIDLSNPDLYRITPLPTNITEQFNAALQNTDKILSAAGITKAP